MEVYMKALLISATLLVSGLLTAQAAEAGSISCSGSHLGYQFGLSAQTRNSRVVGNVYVDVSQDGKLVKRTTLQPTSSNIEPQRVLELNATGAEGRGSLQASYQGSDYRGTLVAGTKYGTFNVAVVCRLSGSALNWDLEE
jgi:hypothetical protein